MNSKNFYKMLKYVDTAVTLSEIPDEITLCINISNCPCHCKGCHSPYLAEDIGERLDAWVSLGSTVLDKLILKNKGITCIAFMGGDSDPKTVNHCARYIRYTYQNLLIAWYSGRQELSKEIELKNFDYIKLGPYIEEKGPLNNPNTNQRLYEICRVHKLPDIFLMKDITSKFWNGK